jgi:hypothetical protein
MHTNPTHYFSHKEPDQSLTERVLLRVLNKKRAVEHTRRRVVGVLGGSAIVGLIPAISSTVHAFAQSNFSSYLSLLFSDGRHVLLYWKELVASLAESFPITNIALTLGLVAVVCWALREWNSAHPLRTSRFISIA